LNDLIKISYEADNPSVSARDLHEGLEIKTAFKDWFPRMSEYGFDEGKDFCSKKSESTGGRPLVDYEISVDMAKQICMIQRTEKGQQYRQYFLDLEKAWNTPDQIIARALKMANYKIDQLKSHNTILIEDIQRMKPKEIFADAVSASSTSILIGEMAKILKQNGVDTGERRFYKWLRENGYLIKRQGTDYNMPTQRSMSLGIFEIKESAYLDGEGNNKVNKTAKVTTKGQQYFIKKFIGDDREVM
jgi:anti-repressor protein